MPNSILTAKQATLRKKIVGVKIRHARIRAGLSLREVGDALDISVDLVSGIEYGEHDVSLPQLEVMAIIFNVPVVYFWSDDTIEDPNFNFPTHEAMTIRQRMIGTLLRQARTEAKHAPEDLSTLLNVPPDAISNYESGKVQIPLQELEMLTTYLDISLDYFIEDDLAGKEEPVKEQAPMPEEITDYSQLPPEIREFLSNPANLLYVNIAMKLSELSAETLRALAEGLLEVTY